MNDFQSRDYYWVFRLQVRTLSEIFLCCLIGCPCGFSMNGSWSNLSSLLAHYLASPCPFSTHSPSSASSADLRTSSRFYSGASSLLSSCSLTKLNLCKSSMIDIRGFPPNSKQKPAHLSVPSHPVNVSVSLCSSYNCTYNPTQIHQHYKYSNN